MKRRTGLSVDFRTCGAGVSLLAALSAAASTLPSCARTPEAGLLVSVSSDLPIPTYVRQIGVLVQRVDGGGRLVPIHAGRYPVREDGTVALPATLGIGPASDSDDRGKSVRISVVGYRAAATGAPSISSGNEQPPMEAFSIREVETRIPQNSTRLLRMPIEFLDIGSAQSKVASGTAGTGTFEGRLEPLTASEKPIDGAPLSLDALETPCHGNSAPLATAVGGECQRAEVDPEHLEAFTNAHQVFGGERSECFDDQPCQGGEVTIPQSAMKEAKDRLGRTVCTIDLKGIPGVVADHVNVFLHTRRTDLGTSSEHTLALTRAQTTDGGEPLADDAARLDSGFTVADQVVSVPGQLCALVKGPLANRAANDDRVIDRVTVSATCRSKKAWTPNCSVRTNLWATGMVTPDVDAGTYDATIPDAGFDAAPDAASDAAVDAGPACESTPYLTYPAPTAQSGAPAPGLVAFTATVGHSWFLWNSAGTLLQHNDIIARPQELSTALLTSPSMTPYDDGVLVRAGTTAYSYPVPLASTSVSSIFQYLSAPSATRGQATVQVSGTEIRYAGTRTLALNGAPQTGPKLVPSTNPVVALGPSHLFYSCGFGVCTAAVPFGPGDSVSMHSSRAGVVELSAGEDDDVTTVANQDADAGTGQALYLGVDKAAHAFTPAPVTGVRVARGPLASAVSWPNGTITSVAIVDHTTKQLKKVEVIAPTVGLVAVADGFLFAAQEGQNVVVRKLPYPCQ